MGADCLDRIGHGTSVAATILGHAPQAELIPVKIFDRSLVCRIEHLVESIEWCAENAVDIVNLSVGTANPMHAHALAQAVARTRAAGVTVVSAYGWLPGSLHPVIAVDEDRTCPEGQFRVRTTAAGRRILACMGNGKGVSFAVANATGLLACLPRLEALDLVEFLVG